MNINFKSAKVLITGGSDGIGKAIAKSFAEAGAEITILSRHEAKLKTTIEELNKINGLENKYIAFDLADSVTKKDELLSKINGDYDILINNAGGPKPGKLSESASEEFEKYFRMHVLAAQIITTYLLKGMKQKGFGRIINIISTSVRQPIPGLGVSNTIRGAMASWSKTLSKEVGEFGITVNNILPGFTKTTRLQEIITAKAQEENSTEEEIISRMEASIPLKRFAGPQEIAWGVLFLCSEYASYINGVNLAIDGGGR